MSVLDLDRRTISDCLECFASPGAGGRIRTYARGRVRYSIAAREVYSYGSHFPLLRYVPRGRGRPLIVLNGDVWRNGGGPSRTADHQAYARELAGAMGETIIVPFSAIVGAGLELDSIRPVHVRQDERWSETIVTRDRLRVSRWRLEDAVSAVDDTGRAIEWTWDEWRHRLGDSLFTAVRAETYVRPARPLEVSRSSSRVTIELAPRDSYCGARDGTDSPGPHVCGPAGACIHCGRPLETRVTVRRRALYLSSFDYNEPQPLYFLAQVPRGAGADTVESAIEALAPRAVHAARARSIPVERQGDIFFVWTPLELAELEARGIVARARVTQWTRDARARRGETGYARPLDAAGRRRMAAWRRREWRRVFADATAKVTAPRPAESLEARAERKRARGAAWRELAERHARELEQAAAAAVHVTDAESSACEDCGAAIGAPCTGYGRRACYGRRPLTESHARELETFRRGAPVLSTAPRSSSVTLPGPVTAAGARRTWREARAKHAAELEANRAAARRAVFGFTGRYRAGRRAYPRWHESQVEADRRELAEHVREIRRRRLELEDRGRYIAAGRARDRDGYRRLFKNPPAAACWSLSGAAARARFYPLEHHGPAIARRREQVRRALAIYGTAHTASEVIRTRAGAVYVRGTVRHIPGLEPGRGGTADHRPLELGPGWWLAVRNTVPRQGSRRRL